MKILLSLKVQL